MARIDLVCKLGSPILMSMFMSVTGSSRVGAFALIALNLITWPFEYWTAKTVWHGSEELRELKSSSRILEEDDTAGEANADQIREERPPVVQIALDCVVKSLKTLLSWIYDYGAGLHYYFTTEVWMPSVAMSMLHFSVLAFSGTLTVFLVNSGFSLGLITWAEVLSAVFELSSTFIFPWGIRVLSAQRKDAYAALPNDTANDTGESGIYEEAEAKDEPSLEEQQRTGVSRLGLWALGLMLLCLVSIPHTFG
ncbi:hypothetical protein MMC28_011607 [Mycoblastus sanguinarius]|nr:hypothetical protein [Mycoblastus sanguinarius]